MGQIKTESCSIPGLVLVHPNLHEDGRGYFIETYQEQEFMEAGITEHFVQDNEAKSSKGVLRGLHFQKKYPQAKQFEIKVAQPAPAAPMSSPHGITSIGSSTILSRQPLIVPTLAWSEAPSALTR